MDPAATQPLRALQRSKEVRARRKVLREQIKGGEVDGLALLRGAVQEWEADALDMRVDRLLRAIPGIGEITTEEVLEIFHLRGSMRISALTYELRDQIAGVIDAVLKGYPVRLPEPPA